VFFKDNKRMSWTETKAMTKNTRIVLATITSPLSDTPNPQYVSLPTPSWAIPLSKYPNAVSHPVHIIKDSQGGTATITEEFGLRKQPVTKITYKNFQWKDSILDGTEEATLIKSDSQEGGLPYFTNMKTDVVSTGKRKGHMYMNATVYEGCAENVQRFSCEVNGKPYFTAWPELGSDCSSDHK
jgi:hypothetical protein